MKFYDGLLEKGFRLAAVSGYDWHSSDEDRDGYFPSTYIGSEKNTQKDLLNGTKSGDTFVSFNGLTCVLLVDNQIKPFGTEVMRGQNCELVFNRPAKFVKIESTKYIRFEGYENDVLTLFTSPLYFK